MLWNTLVLPRTSILPPLLRNAARSAAIRSLVIALAASAFLEEVRVRARFGAGWRVSGLAVVLDIASPVGGVHIGAPLWRARLVLRTLRAQRFAVAGQARLGRWCVISRPGGSTGRSGFRAGR